MKAKRHKATLPMLSYQHSYHAGGPADLHKHAALSLILGQMVEKDKAMTYVETHAGRGLYDLATKEAEKTGEAALGVLRLDVEGAFGREHPYAQVIRAVRRLYGKTFYPGSPLIARALLRDEDRLTLCELHPQEFAVLQENLADDAVSIVKEDGFAHVLAKAPMTPRRGLVFIDPSFEIKGDYEAAADFVIKLHQKWGVAVILLWYPILEQGFHTEMVRRLKVAGFPDFWQQEVLFPQSMKKRALGSGLLAVNLPYGTEEPLGALTAHFQD